MHWRVELFSELRVVCGERVVTRLESRKIVALLARLALQPQRVHTREELADLLWPESDRETGLARLRHALSSLRRTLVPTDLTGDGFFIADRQNVRVRPEALSCDVRDFESAVRQKKWTEAQRLYTGELLPGLYDDWICDERERLAALAQSLPESVDTALGTPGSALPALGTQQCLLPGYLTRFLGRETEREQLTTLVTQCRLITLLGPGGIGKTRLATELAQQLAAHYAVVAFVPLAECFDASQLVDRVRAALQLAGGERSALEQLVPFLYERPTLLVLDNLEQLVESGASEALEQLLLAIPSLTCLVTSRQVLGVAGEQVFALPPLAAAPSLALFQDRARAARPDFTVSERNHEALMDLCKKLEGIPLALELAASRIRSLTPREMQSQLEQSLRLLARPSQGNPRNARHASLHAAIEWSWQLLPSHQQIFLAQLSVFRGGWSAPAAQAICGITDATDRLAALTDASLVLCDGTADGSSRFRLLELIRSFAAEQLPEALAAETRAQHRAYFAAHATDQDAGNVLAALESACVCQEAAAAYPLFLTQASGTLALLGAPRALSLGLAILALPAPTPRERLAALGHTVSFADTCGYNARAHTLAQEALDTAGSDPVLRAIALSIQGQLAVSNYADPTTSLPVLREALSLSESAGDVSTQATVLRRLGILLLRSKHLDEAAHCFECSEQLFASVGDLSGARYALANRAHVLGVQGDSLGSLALYQTCLARARALGDRVHQSKLLLNIGSLQAELRLWEEALESAQACVRVCQAIGNLRTLTFALWNLPEPLLHLGRPEQATLLMAFAETFWLVRFPALTDEDSTYRDGIYAGSNATAAQRATGSTLSLSEALALALG